MYYYHHDYHYHHNFRYGDDVLVNKVRAKEGDTTTFDECVAQQLSPDCDPKRMWIQVTGQFLLFAQYNLFFGASVSQHFMILCSDPILLRDVGPVLGAGQ